MRPQPPTLLDRARRRGRRELGAGAAAARRAVGRLWRRADPLVDLVDPNRRRCFPRREERLHDYRNQFVRTARVFELFLRRAEDIGLGSAGGPVAVVVMPWFGTAAPWYAVALGLGLAARSRPVTFVWHDVPFPDEPEHLVVQHNEIGRMMRILAARFPVIRVGDRPAAASRHGDEVLLDELADANLTWILRGGAPSDADVALGRRMRASLEQALPRVRSVAQATAWDYLVVPGGVVAASGLYVAAGREAGVRVATFDAGLGAAAIDVEGVAAQHTDAPRAFALLEQDLAGDHEEVVREAREEYERRRAGADFDGYQVARPGTLRPDTPPSILIPLSVMFDAAALGRHHIFAGSEEWLVETIRVLLEETTDPIIVRQHPSERRAEERSRFDAAGILQRAFGDNRQIRFIGAAEDVSTYDLLEVSRLVLPFVSTIGIEAAALGKPVILAGAVYYAPMGFAWAPQARDEYVDLVRRGARGALATLPGQVDRAWRCYYLTAVCQRVWTNFTSQPPDFWRWVERGPTELFADPDVDDLLRAVDENVPLPILRHRRRALARAGASS